MKLDPPEPPASPEPKAVGWQWNLVAVGPRSERSVYIGDVPPGTWEANLYVLGPGVEGFLHFVNKRGKDNYGWNDAPPGGSVVLETSVNALNAVINVVAPAADVAVTALGVPPGVVTAVAGVLTKLVGLIPDAVERSRVEQWAKWREGQVGEPAVRARIKAQVERWRDVNGLAAKQGAELHARYYWQGEGPAMPLLPLPEPTRGKAIPPTGAYTMVDAPRLSLLPKAGTEWREVYLVMPATELVPTGERRYVFDVRPA